MLLSIPQKRKCRSTVYYLNLALHSRHPKAPAFTLKVLLTVAFALPKKSMYQGDLQVQEEN
jgi:hypothetical protein